MPRQAKRSDNTQAPAFLGSNASNAELGVRSYESGPITYLSAESLKRPLELPRSQARKLLPIIIVAVLLSAAVVAFYNATVLSDVQRTQELVSEAIARDVSLDLPRLQDYAGKSNEAMMKSFTSDGYVIYDNSNDEDRNVDGFDVFKLASDADPEKAAAAYAQGIENLGDVETAWYLAGSWRFLVTRVNNPEIRLRYVDFDATDATSAISAAVESQGFEDADMTKIAQDVQGNTNLSGTFKKEKVTYEYTISACDLDQVYDIEGMPDGAQFVGIRVSVAE